MTTASRSFNIAKCLSYISANFDYSDNALHKLSALEKTLSVASKIFRGVCSEEPPYHTTEPFREGLRQEDEGVR